jgi:UDP-N-acetylmuramate--alanine ligase
VPAGSGLGVAESLPSPVGVDLSHPQSIHIIGVGGAGMSAIAGVLASMGHRVSGSDLTASSSLERLQDQGLTTVVGHDAANVGSEVELVTRSTAIPDDNAEVEACRRRGLAVLSRADMLAAIAATRSAIAVAGTHGKTTTSSMLALILVEAGMHPSYIIGGDLHETGTGSQWDEGEWFVIEADESDGTFLVLPRHGAIVTNVEPDHIEFWGGFAALRDGFKRFLRETPGPRVVCADDAGAWELVCELEAEPGARPIVSYGTDERSSYVMRAVHRSRAGTTFRLEHDGSDLGEIRLPIGGLHNAYNAAAAVTMALELGAPLAAAQAAMVRFAGVARRFQFRGEAGGVSFIDDYAHLPSEIAAMVSAAADGRWNRVVCVFQPHRYSRIAALWATFADAFAGVDLLVVTDIYASGEAPRPGVSGKLIADAVLDAHPRQRLAYLAQREDVAAFLGRELRPGDLCLTLGAGDLTTLPDEMLARLALRPTAVSHPSPEVDPRSEVDGP